MNPGDLVLFVDQINSKKYHGVILHKKTLDSYKCQIYPCLSNTNKSRRQYDFELEAYRLQPLNSHKVRVRNEVLDFYMQKSGSHNNQLQKFGYEYLFEARGAVNKADVLGTIPPNTIGDTLLRFGYTINNTFHYTFICGFSDVEFVATPQQQANTCKCDIMMLMNKGCQCGGV